MKAISLWQPWASLIAIGAKRFETRSWPTSYRGPLLICAAKGGLPKKELFDILAERPFFDALCPRKNLSLSVLYSRLPFGAALCIVDLVDCIRTDSFWGTHEKAASSILKLGNDYDFGDFRMGRFAWRIENVKAFQKPFPVKGKQRLFEVNDLLISDHLAHCGEN